MALSFVTGTMTLSSWGFGAGDIAVMAGAGRFVGNWLMAQRQDRALLDFLALQPEDILQRKGLVDTVALHNRWDKRLVLLKNGRRHVITHPSTGNVVENMDSFTWFMSLLVATLDAAVGSKTLKELVVQLLLDIIGDKTTGSVDYLLNEAQQHIMGWRSSACVRSISHTASSIWQRLAREGKHLPGEIPGTDSEEMLRLLIWIISGSSCRFTTTSTDIVCLASILSELGLELLVIDYDGRTFDENRLVVSFSVLPLFHSLTLEAIESTKRRGMRIPLNDFKECVTLWPVDGNRRNQYRTIFTYGARAAEGVRLVVSGEKYYLDEEEIDVCYVAEQQAKLPGKRAGEEDTSILNEFLLVPTLRAAQFIAKFNRNWPSKSRQEIGHWLGEVDLSKNTEAEIAHFGTTTRKCLAELQVFLLGYWYTILQPLVDTSQLPVQEAYGSWGWNDIQVVKAFRRLTLAKDPDSHRIPRFEVIRLIGYLFAGAEYDDQLLPLKIRSVGVLGKLALVTAGLMGGADTPEKVGMFFLLDVDASCIPSNSRGIILCGLRKLCPAVATQSMPQAISQSLAESPSGDDDFSSHIEPDWGYDTQRVLVAYRDRGRIVHRVSPVDGDLAVLTSWIEPVRLVQEGEARDQPFATAIRARLEEYHGGVQIRQRDLTTAEFRARAECPSTPELGIVILTNSLPKARACIVSMYGAGVAALCSNSFAKAAEDTALAAIIA
ncbi:hypothetical protein MMC32_001079 [Xylographa parallela]|nr:hypothetical protein [Xylographa parallela]